MKRFMIGQFERFDMHKQERDFREGFFGVEATQMKSLEALEGCYTWVNELVNGGA